MENLNKELVLKYEKEYLEDLAGLIEIPSVLTEYNPESEKYPFGEKVYEALPYMEKLAKKYGFKYRNIDNRCGEISYGEGNEYIGIFAHADVVGVSDGWKHDPFKLIIENNILYGRGVEDDKGALIASLYSLRILKDLGYKPNNEIKLVFGLDEETGSRGLAHYLTKNKMPKLGFTPDAHFPLVQGEKGIVRLNIVGKVPCNCIEEMNAGVCVNMVPGFASMRLEKIFFDKIKQTNSNIKLDSNTNTVIASGVSSHASTPEQGKSAVFELINIIKDLNIKNNFARLLVDLFDKDLYGKLLKIDKEDKYFGKLTLNLGMVELKDNTFKLSVDIRHPMNTTGEKIIKAISKKVKKYNAEVEVIYTEKVIFADSNSKLVKNLLKVYQDVSNDFENKPLFIGGGTYARLFPNTVVAFGSHFPGDTYKGHEQDESIPLWYLLDSILIYAKAVIELDK